MTTDARALEDEQFARSLRNLPPTIEVTEVTTPGGNVAKFTTRTDTNDGAVAYALLTADEYRLASMSPMTGWAIDIGAHIGSISIAMALDNPDLKVVAVEALPENADLVRQNVEINGLRGRVFVESMAATDDAQKPVEITYNYRMVGVGRTGETVDETYLNQCRYIGNIFQADDSHDQDNDVATVDGISLAGILKKYKIDRVGFLKIDCEGCEYQFFKSKAMDKVDLIVGEYHDARTFADIEDLLNPTHIAKQWPGHAGPVGLFDAVRRD